ncbi:TPA: ribosome-associated translation inhibitor RaiA [Candidatus Saccharibacteria bacterium]|nr:ribosome-associated translation inhibitor RaiA [Candidatus Saccharibacteria bacterium]HIO87235.1 ribosome-associated translation inhibitor RaiA [Candidatus Saccharibacteria bacterium]
MVKIDIKSDGYDLDDQSKKYAESKIVKLGKKLNKHQKDSLHAIVTLKETSKKSADIFEAEILLRLPPKEELIAKESAQNMLAALDIVESKLDRQLRKYKTKFNENKKDRKNSFAKLRKLADRDFWGRQN